MAETTTATSLPFAASRATSRATVRIRSVPAIDVPPNFITIRAMSPRFPDLVSAATFQDFRGVRLLGKGRREGKVGMGPSGINFLAASKRGCPTRAHECRDDQPARRSEEHMVGNESVSKGKYRW